jgi:hypothetical protein
MLRSQSHVWLLGMMGKVDFYRLRSVCSRWNMRGIGVAANNEGLCPEKPDKGVQVSHLSGQKGGLKQDSYRAEPPGSFSSVSGVNSPICTA